MNPTCIVATCSTGLGSSLVSAAPNPCREGWFPSQSNDGAWCGTRHAQTNGSVTVPQENDRVDRAWKVFQMPQDDSQLLETPLRDQEADHRAVLKARERFCGQGHPDVFWTMHRLAMVLKSAGRLQEACDLARLAAHRAAESLGANHAATKHYTEFLQCLGNEMELRAQSVKGTGEHAMPGSRWEDGRVAISTNPGSHACC